MQFCRKSSYIFLVCTLIFVNLSVARAAVTDEPSGLSLSDEYFVEMKDKPVVSYTGGVKGLSATSIKSDGKLNLNTYKVKQYRSFLKRQSSSLKDWISKNTKSALVLSEYTTTINALAVKASPDDIKLLANAPGVKRITRSKLYEPQMNKSHDIINTGAAWKAGLDGTGVKVAVIDSGIDQDHPFLRSSTLKMPSGFPKTDKFNWQKFTSNKVIVAKVFSPNAKATPEAKDSHGTHVAGTIAGASGYVDPSNLAHTPLSGVAPNVYLGNYNVFPCKETSKCRTSSASVASAIEEAVNDGMDVANLSLGSSATPGMDLLVDVVNGASQAGMTMVISAGNRGPDTATIGSPGTAESAITVGSVNNSHFFGLTIDAVAGKEKRSLAVALSQPGGQLKRRSAAASLAVIDEDQRDGCKPLTENLKGKVALLKRGGGCTFTDKATNAMNAGARGVILVNNTDGTPSTMSVEDTVKIPMVMVNNVDGAWLMDKGDKIKVTMRSGEMHEFDSIDAGKVSSFSSRGPSIYNKLKPDVAAVGANVYSSVPGGGFESFNGTSMSAPHVTGAVALLLQSHPDWEPQDIKAALMGTAVDAVGETLPVEVGAGVINVGNALSPIAMSYPSSLSFGVASTKKKSASNISVDLKNVTEERRTYKVETDEVTTGVKVTKNSFSLEPGEEVSLKFSMFSRFRAKGLYQGYINVKSGTERIRIPYLFRVVK